VRTTRIFLFALLGATIAGAIALAVESNVTRGPALSFTLVPAQSATSADLQSDAAAMVRRLISLGYKDTLAKADGDAIDVTMYGSAPKLRAALLAALPAASLEMRPVECAAPAFSGVGSSGNQIQSLPQARPACAAKYLLTAEALRVDTTTGLPATRIATDPGLASVPSTSQSEDQADLTVLLPTGAAAGFEGDRIVAGPAEVANVDVVSAQASLNSPEWVLDLNLTTAGEKAYNALAKNQFHAYIAVDIDGTIVSAPIIEPTSSTFAAFGAKVAIDAGYTKAQAVALADDLTSPLVIPLKLAN
jgi:preprotein translocase subunit SecD